MKKVSVSQQTVMIPTYQTAPYDKNPMFLEKRVYQGSSGRVYPHPVCEGVANEKKDKAYQAIILENDYIQVMILPELGGRIQRLYDKTNGYDAVYYNEVIKPALVGLAGPWISGGIEFNWPQHHRPSTFDPVDFRIVEHEDGSVTVYTGETEKMFHTKGEAGFTVYPDKSYLEIRGRVYNPTDRPQTFLWWANPAVPVNNYTRSIFPPDVTAVMDHGKRDVSKFPIADGVYYKVNYAPGTDISRYKNIPVPTSYMAAHSDYDFIGNYDDEKQAGLLHVASHHVSPGKKQWTWGNGDFGRAWDRNLTDENGPYIELMTGMFTDNQPDFTYLKPYEEKSFVQYFMPMKTIGAVKNANKDLAINIEKVENGLRVCIYSSSDNETMQVVVRNDGEVLWSEEITLQAAESLEKMLPCFAGAYEMDLIQNGKAVLSFRPVENESIMPDAAKVMEEPAKIATNEELFLDGVHLEQYRHATYKPEDYYLEGLRRDPSDLRINNAYGKLLFARGRFAESLPYFEAAIKKSTMRNPNPYDCEPYFNYGLALVITGEPEKAYDAFYKATWDGNLRDKAYYQLALLECKKRDFTKALEFVEESLIRGLHNLKARTLKTAILRHLGCCEQAVAFAKETEAFDPLDMGAAYELALLGQESTFTDLIRGDSGSYIELALGYLAADLTEEVLDLLNRAGDEDPMVGYYRFFVTNDFAELAKAEKASSLYCFPNRPEDIPVLEKAQCAGGIYAGYYLGLLWYDKGNWQASQKCWEQAAEKMELPTVYRNLSLLYYNKCHEPQKAEEAMLKAFAMDEDDARVFFELDQLYKIRQYPLTMRYENMRTHQQLLECRDDLYTEYVAVLNGLGKYAEAMDAMSGHLFHPWEGGEGKITKEYRIALMGRAEAEKDDAKAVELLKQAFTYPENLGEGKLIGAMDHDLYYLLGERSTGAEKEEYYKMGARGEMNLSSAMYYNDQPPEEMFYRSLCLDRLGQKAEAEQAFKAMIAYGQEHMEDEVKIDYFAVSLPDFLIFEGDMVERNQKHCANMIRLGQLGLEKIGQK